MHIVLRENDRKKAVPALLRHRAEDIPNIGKTGARTRSGPPCPATAPVLQHRVHGADQSPRRRAPFPLPLLTGEGHRKAVGHHQQSSFLFQGVPLLPDVRAPNHLRRNSGTSSGRILTPAALTAGRADTRIPAPRPSSTRNASSSVTSSPR
ncbi:hypothetical protein SDC9_94679 [bioreactor metagenome]|uniref:Uncharacterized protein n=1 Tax=bioreactor metagenome TaxID=1076179 RepID=A0A645A5I5_9ZZZZ